MPKRVFLCGVFAVGTLLSGVTSGCGSGGGGIGGSAIGYGPLAGTWRATAITGGGDDIPCPARIVASGSPGSGTSLPQFGCGAADTFTFRADNTFTVTKADAPDGPFTGRWAQFQTRALLSVDDPQDAVFPYGTELLFRNENQFTALVPGVASINRYVFTRQ